MDVWQQFQSVTMPKSALIEGHVSSAMEGIPPLCMV